MIEVNITKKLSGFTLNINFCAPDICTGLLGASGCGKSMTLKCIAGIQTPDSGYIIINGKTVFDSSKHINLKPQERKCGFLFQNYALFPKMTVEQNIEEVLYKFPQKIRKQKTEQMLERFGLTSYAKQKPATLSGGQQQRAALARIMVLQPEIIMLDEPFSALDAFLKQQIEMSVMQLLDGFKGTILFVSHNRDEVFRLCKNIHVINDGKITRSGSCSEIFSNPQTVSAAKLSGCKNIAEVKKIDTRTIFVPDWNLTLKTAITVPENTTHVGVRAHFIREPLANETENCFTFTAREYRNSPFSISQYLGIEGSKKLLDREISVDSGTIIEQIDSSEQKLKLCIPASSLMLLHV